METRNQILAGLPAEKFERLQPYLKPIPLEMGRELAAPGEEMTEVYFPEAGIVSAVAQTEEAQVEAGLIGRDGFVGLPVVFGVKSSPLRYIVQVPGSALRMRAADLQRLVAEAPDLLPHFLSYAHLMGLQTAQTSACNARHHLNERLARWMLMVHDRVDGDTLKLTQEFIGQMLGVRRAGVTVAVGLLEEAGILRGSRGKITVLDRDKLERAACECYRIVGDEESRVSSRHGSSSRRPQIDGEQASR